jgi:hypothetical protein
MASVGRTASDQTTGVGLVSLWFALLVGPAAWLGRLLVSSVLVPVVCRQDAIWILHGIAAATAALCVAGIVVSAKERGRGGRQEHPPGTAPDVTSFLLVLALLTNAVALALIIMESSPNFFIDPCK